MDHSLSSAAQRLAKNILSLRQARHLSQSQLAQIAEIPRTTLTHIESGSGNPSLQNLLRVASALQVSVEELLSPLRVEVSLIKASDISKKIKKAGVEVHKLLPDPIPGMEIDKILLEPGARMKGTPHVARTKEYFYCSAGKFEVYVNKKVFYLNKGDLLAFPGDSSHAYVNSSQNAKATGFSVVTLNHNYSAE